jgi:hypothetical protein
MPYRISQLRKPTVFAARSVPIGALTNSTVNVECVTAGKLSVPGGSVAASRTVAEPKPRYALFEQNMVCGSTSVEWTGSSQ